MNRTATATADPRQAAVNRNDPAAVLDLDLAACIALAAELTRTLERRRARAKNDRPNWGHVGTLAVVRESLERAAEHAPFI